MHLNYPQTSPPYPHFMEKLSSTKSVLAAKKDWGLLHKNPNVSRVATVFCLRPQPWLGGICTGAWHTAGLNTHCRVNE